MKRFLLFPALFFVSCYSAKIDIIQAGPWFEPRNKKEVEIFADRNKVKRPFGAIAVIHSERYRCLAKNHEKYLKKSVEEAAKIGADAIVYAIGEDPAELNPGVPPECYISAMAVKYTNEIIKK